MKIFYVAERINSKDGSSVHCRAFVENAVELGHNVVTYPEIIPIEKLGNKYFNNGMRWKNISAIIGLLFRKIKRKLHQSNGYLSETLWFCEGLLDSIIQGKKLFTIMNSNNFDLVIYRMRCFNLGPFWAAKKAGLPVFCEINSLRSMETVLRKDKAVSTFITRWAENKALEEAGSIAVVSSTLKKKIRDLGYKCAIAVVPNGVNEMLFNPKKVSHSKAKASLGVEGKIVIGYVGSFKPWHGLNTTIETFKILYKKSRFYHLILVGSGVELENIRELVKESGLSNAVTFIKSIKNQEMPKILAAIDIALMTYPKLTDFYFSPLKLFEYMSMEIPVVTTWLDEISIDLLSNNAAKLVKTPTPIAFADAVENILSEGESIGRNARAFVVSKYTWKKNVKRIIDFASIQS